MWCLALLSCLPSVHHQDPSRLPEIVLEQVPLRIDRSCRVVIPQDKVFTDPDGVGVLQIVASGITVEFAPGSALHGAPRPTAGNESFDTYLGVGIRITNVKNVTLRSPAVHGFKVGIWATQCDGLVVAGGDLSDNFRQRLRSTPLAEDAADWLRPHQNDQDQWAHNYGSALYVREAKGITIHDLHIRRGQNGILLHSVHDSSIYDNDASFLSGWGLGLFRSSGNTICRNAFDFCIRGHVEGRYNRGQDSAGILMFEQCSNNVIAYNSLTHGGDGLFSFAGVEALGDTGAKILPDYRRLGCNDNLLLGNDASYASAHGIEMTFSFGNKVIDNRIMQNAICGIWGGYSQDMVIARNRFSGNGGMPYGLERGGINIEHGAGNRILDNDFHNDRCGVHLWWRKHAALEAKPWAKANYRGAVDNMVANNRVVLDDNHPFTRLGAQERLPVLHLRDGSDAADQLRGTRMFGNEVQLVSPLAVLVLNPNDVPIETGEIALSPIAIPKFVGPGKRQPVGARAHLSGRHQILMSEWGPFDHQGTMLRPVSTVGTPHLFEVYGAKNVRILEILEGDGILKTNIERHEALHTFRLNIDAGPGVHPYRIRLQIDDNEREIRGTIVSASFDLTVFSWTADTDPRKHLEAWRALAERPTAHKATVTALRFDYGSGGPRQQAYGKSFPASAPGPDHFGMIARTKLTLPAGRYRFTTLSDDGVRVRVDRHVILENWTWHGPTRDVGIHQQEATSEVEIEVEHFEIDGHAVLHLEIEVLSGS